jgi:exodeoxyribonuclease VII large subunit
MANHITLFQLNSIVRQTLDTNLEPSYWVIAEIGEIRMAPKGHCYLELVEKAEDNICAKIKANIWAYTYRNICGWFESITGKSLRPGMKILTQVTVSFHEIYGLSLNIKDIDPNFTLGERSKKRQQVIDQLKEEGVFEMNRTLFLPLVPQRVAVISSPSAAGYEDFMMHLQENPYNYTLDISLFKAVMQGSEAKSSIIKALHQINKNVDDFDLLVIIRGGGAQVDLDCFDTYDLCSHIAQFPLPVITGIGHERDETIVDLVAHTKLKTPTAVAEFLLSGLRTFDEKLTLLLNRILAISENLLKDQNHILNDLFRKLNYNSKNLLSENKHKLAQIESDLNYYCKNQLKKHENHLKLLQDRLITDLKNVMNKEQMKLEKAENSLRLLNPENILKRGYSITRINNININKIEHLQEGDIISTETIDRVLQSKLNRISTKPAE